ncbi:hypothetical protein Mapa_001817 [Marchantia paleacea]|nr:hypothetical protein Mapa_001817 [Marchantia paleacea]
MHNSQAPPAENWEPKHEQGAHFPDDRQQEYFPSNGTRGLNGSESQSQMENIPLEKTPSMMKSQEKVLLHGSLDVYIYQAKSLPNMDMFSEKLRQVFSVFNVCKAPFQNSTSKAHKAHRSHVITSDPYVSVVLAGARLARTRVIANNQDPVWNEHFLIPVAHSVSEIVFSIKDNDLLGAQLIGNVEVPVSAVVEAGEAGIEGWFDVMGSAGKVVRENAQLRLKIAYLPVHKNLLYRSVVEAGPEYFGVPNTYFPLRKGGNVVLYHDAHVEEHTLPDFKLDNGLLFQHRRCWEDICTAILEAHHLVYIAGWSIYDKIKLMRDINRPIPDGGDLTLGELLKRKSKEGVRVLLLVWDDKTSHNKPLIKTEGVMGTHDEDTKKFFRHSAVRCVLAPRYGDNKLSWFRQQVVGTLYTHHQKIVICDAQGPGNTRKVSAFLGGLDLCDGRYDTPGHPLFRHMDTVYKDDYHQPTFNTTQESGGPRQPWHDLHCRIDGPAAYDVLTNFEQRWKKATRWHDDELIEIGRISWILGPTKETKPQGDPHLMVSEDEDPETWHVQIFRSIDSGSAKGFPKNVQEAERQNLVWRKNIAVDVSIQTAYIKAIRGAQKFIYIENQYFLGSSYAWPDYKAAGADQMIPMELALKIASKIRANERFVAYIAIPMWPEGAPDSAAVQEILYFQSQTVQMMYTIIADAIRDQGRSDDPRDYLNFYCLANRETKSDSDPSPSKPPDPNSKQGLVHRTRRMMIYIHSKGMIVDDEYVIIGSANINQRSMDGSRDTEIAMGAYQPHHTHARALKHPHGQIYGYRLGLWAEHLGFLAECFNDPSSLECVHTINEAAEKNWEQYTTEEVTDMKGHLMPYPYEISFDGQVSHKANFETFPDVGGKIMGTNTQLPDNLTT